MHFYLVVIDTRESVPVDLLIQVSTDDKVTLLRMCVTDELIEHVNRTFTSLLGQ